MTDAALLQATDDPAAAVAAVEARGTRVGTPCGDGEMVWRIWGEGTPLVLLHGGHGAWSHWIRNVPVLVERYRVIVPDMPGYGDSASPPAPYTADSLAGIMAEGLDHILGDAPFLITGFSFGGVMGGHLAKARPQRTERLVIVGSGGLGLRRSDTPMQNWRRMERPEDRLAAHRHNLASLMLHDPAKIDALALHLQAANTQRTRINSRKISLTDALTRALPQFPAPLGAIWGVHDATSIGELLDAREALIRSIDPGVEFVRLDAGHWVPYEAPEAFNAALIGILETPRRTRG